VRRLNGADVYLSSNPHDGALEIFAPPAQSGMLAACAAKAQHIAAKIGPYTTGMFRIRV
jgi:hypothetical protein